MRGYWLVFLVACGDNLPRGVPDGGAILDTAPSGDLPPFPQLALSPLTHDFGGVDLACAGIPATFTVSNQGHAASSPVSTVIMGSGATAFAISADTCAGTSLAVGASCTFVVGTALLHVGTSSAAVQVSGGGAVTAVLDVTGLAAAPLFALPSVVGFPTTEVGATATAMAITVSNDSGCPRTASLATALGGADASSFAVTTDGCNGQELAGGASCTIDVAFAPTAAGSRTATLSIADVSVTLSGTATPAPANLVIAPTLHDFSSAFIGCSSTDATFTVSNLGGVASSAVAIAFGGADAMQFAIGQDACTGTVLAPGGACIVTAAFHPLSVGARTATLTASAGSVQASATVLGTGLAPGDLAISPSSLDFGGQAVGTSSSARTVTLTNGGGCSGGKLTVSRAGNQPGDFTIASDTCSGTTLTGHQTCSVDLVFSPTASGARSATLTFVGAGVGVATAGLAGTGQ